MQSKVFSSDIKIGMFISSLDRPWIDTPFMLQGFLVESDEDIRLLRQYCEFVFVDWSMSPLPAPNDVLMQQTAKATERVVRHASTQAVSPNIIRPHSPDTSNVTDSSDSDSAPFAESDLLTLPPTKKPTRSKPAHSPQAHLSEPHQTQHIPEQSSFFADVTGKMLSFFKRNPKATQAMAELRQARADLDEDSTPYVRPDFIPADIPVMRYADITPAEQEVAPAVKAHKRAKEVLANLVQDIQSNKHLALEETEEVVHEVVDTMVRNPDAMMWITRLRKQDEVVYGHGLQVAVYLVALGRHLGLPKEMLERLCTMGLLLDMGKIKLPKTLLLKKERLNSEEFEMIKSHVQIGLGILKETPDLHPDVLQGIAQHHEREDGSGYPAGLSKDEIGLFGRMAAIVDTFAALTNPRPYAKTIPAYEALQTLSNFNQGLYQASMVEQFIQAIGVFPVGSMVELSTGEIAVVTGHSKVRRLKPRVLIISDADKRPLPQPTSLDLLYQPQELNQNPISIQRGLPAGAFGLDAREFYLS